jgi:hypothetical protein
VSDWPVEEIPNADPLYLRDHRTFRGRDGLPNPGAFKNRPDGAPGMSVDWSRYASPAQTRAGGGKPATEYAVAAMLAGDVRDIPGQTVAHDPLPANRAHSQAYGDKNSSEIRVRFRRIATLVVDWGD